MLINPSSSASPLYMCQNRDSLARTRAGRVQGERWTMHKNTEERSLCNGTIVSSFIPLDSLDNYCGLIAMGLLPHLKTLLANSFFFGSPHSTYSRLFICFAPCTYSRLGITLINLSSALLTKSFIYVLPSSITSFKVASTTRKIIYYNSWYPFLISAYNYSRYKKFDALLVWADNCRRY
jgi:hypothetical protein